MPRVGHPWRKHFNDAPFIFMEVDTSMMIILVMSWNTSTTAQVRLSWFCHKIVMDVHAWQKTWPTVTNMYHHRSIFFCSDITRCVPRYGHWGHTCTWEITYSWSRRSNKNQCNFCAEIDSGGLLGWRILRTCYWIHTRSGTTAAFYLSFYKLTLFLILKMFVRLSFRKWFRQAWPRNCAQWRSSH